jgi:glycosyltransferase involved in cell wall biosynthesis
LRILQIIAAYKPAYIYGGPTMSAAELSEQLQAAGCEVTVYTTTANGPAELEVPAGEPVNVNRVKVTYFNRITKDHTHFSPALLKTLWQTANQYDVVHIHAWWNLVSVGSAIIALWRRVPVVISPRGTLSTYSFQHRNQKLKKAGHWLLKNWILRKCHVHATSIQEQKELQQIIKPKSFYILPNFVQLPARFSCTKAVSTAPLRLLFYSRIDAKKGLELLLQALPILTFTCQLTIAGSGAEDYIGQLKDLTQANGTSPYINWAGFIEKEKFALLQQHDVLVLPSYNENFGNVVVEGLSVGMAVLISKYVGLAGYIAQHHLGWICDTTPTSIAGQLQNINNNRQQLHSISEKAPGLIYSDFTGSTLAKAYLNYYQRIINQTL